MIRSDPETGEISLSVRDLVELDAPAAIRAEPMAIRARAGSREHVRHHAEREREPRREDQGEYRSEVTIRWRTERRGRRIAVEGRIDGLQREGNRWVVEEVKTVILDPERVPPGELSRRILEEGAHANHRLQLELYVFFLRDPRTELPADLAAQFAPHLSAHPSSSGSGEPGGEISGRLVLRYLAPPPETAGDRPEGSAPAIEGTRATVEFSPDPARLAAWIDERLDRVIDHFEEAASCREARRRAAGSIAFPFPRPRPGQTELSEEVRSALEAREHLLTSAPTGVGKTAAVLHAALRFALENDLRIFYATARTTQRRIVAETLERIAAASGWCAPRAAESTESPEPAATATAIDPSPPPFRAVVLRAREKLCPNLEERGFIHCHEDVCPYAREYARKIGGARALERLLAGPVALPEEASRLGRSIEACPYELTIDAALGADLAVGDFNHLFDPSSRLSRLLDGWSERGTILIIDEAHNLPSRARDAFSPEISGREAAALERWARDQGQEAARAFARRVERLLAALADMGREHLGDPPVFPVDLDPATVNDLSAELEEIRLRRLLERGRGAPPGTDGPPARTGSAGRDPLESFASAWSRFAATREALEGVPHRVLFDRSDAARGPRLRLLCLDPSVPLARRLEEFRSVVALSATLEPFPFYRDVLGFPPERTRFRSFPSPFPPENRKILVWDQISTYFRSRAKDAPKVARLIEEVAALEPGNYLAAFPSYAYLREVERHLPPAGIDRRLVQTPGMDERERDRLLARLAESGSRRTLLAVQGGLFTEGVDYPGRMLIGVIVVGPGLPAVGYDEEAVREHYQERFGEGFNYAYLYPGMNRVVQSAGRLIRDERDTGVILLVGERFARLPYQRALPSHWYRASPRELIARDPIGEIEDFWRGRREKLEVSP